MKKISFPEFSLANINRSFDFFEKLTGCYGKYELLDNGVDTIRCNLYTCKKFLNFGMTAFDRCVANSDYYGYIFTAKVIKNESISDNKLLLISKDKKTKVEADFSSH